jgi:hypothetical protein
VSRYEPVQLQRIWRHTRWALAAVWLVLGCACAGRHQTIEYASMDDHRHRAREHPAELSELSPEQLAVEGYVPIGVMTVIRVTSICFETCKKIEHRQSVTDTLLTEAGKRGGDLVVLEHDKLETTHDVEEQGRCLESYIEERTVGEYVPPVGGAGNRWEPEERSVEVCTEFEVRHGHETFQQSSGVVWRRESSTG